MQTPWSPARQNEDHSAPLHDLLQWLPEKKLAPVFATPPWKSTYAHVKCQKWSHVSTKFHELCKSTNQYQPFHIKFSFLINHHQILQTLQNLWMSETRTSTTPEAYPSREMGSLLGWPSPSKQPTSKNVAANSLNSFEFTRTLNLLTTPASTDQARPLHNRPGNPCASISQ